MGALSRIARSFFRPADAPAAPPPTASVEEPEVPSRTIDEGRDALKVLQAELTTITERLESLSLGDTKGSIKDLIIALRRQLRYTQRLTPAKSVTNLPATLDDLERLAQSDHPIVVGPWVDDVATELLYWVPFVRWFARDFLVPPERICAVSRGGAPWYGDIAGEYVDLLSVYPESELRAQLTAAGRSDATFAQELLAAAAPRLPQDARVLHPGYLRAILDPYLAHERPLRDVVQCSAPQPLAPLPDVPLPPLPPRFAAVRFAFSDSFPDTPSNRLWLETVLDAMTQAGEVVWIGDGAPGVDGPGRTNYVPSARTRLHVIDLAARPDQSVLVQAAIVARAEACVTTYGGISYLGSFLGVRSVAFHSHAGFFPHYRRMAEIVSHGRHVRPPVVIDVGNVGLLRRVLERNATPADSAPLGDAPAAIGVALALAPMLDQPLARAVAGAATSLLTTL